jgi:hypothetical protein
LFILRKKMKTWKLVLSLFLKKMKTSPSYNRAHKNRVKNKKKKRINSSKKTWISPLGALFLRFARKSPANESKLQQRA